jgi:hypothetical protein
MATDNVTLNVGTGGDTVRTLADADGNEWQPVVASYATSISAGNNVLQIVDGSHGLPVAQQGDWVVSLDGTPTVEIADAQSIAVTQDDASALKATVSLAPSQTLAAVTSITNAVEIVQDTAADLACTAHQGGTWTVSLADTPTVEIADAQTIGATQSGSWTVGLSSGQTIAAVTAITDPVAVTQSGDWTFDLDSVAITGAVEVVQDTAEDLLTTAYQGGTWEVGISGTPTVKIDAEQSIAATQGGTWNVGISGTPSVAQSGTWTVGLAAAQTIAAVTAVGAITSPVTVAQSTAANLKATVDIASGQSVGLAAGTNLAGKVSAGTDTSTLYAGTTALTPKYAKIAASASGQTAVVDGVSGKKIRVLRMGYTASAATNVKWQSGSTDLTGLESMIAGSKGGAAYCEVGVIETGVGEDLNIDLSSAATVGGMLTYVEVS